MSILLFWLIVAYMLQISLSEFNCTADQDCIVNCLPGVCGSKVNCLPGYDCQVNCNGFDACDYMTIDCENTIDCTVVCDGTAPDTPCTNLEIKATSAKTLTFTSKCGEANENTQCASYAAVHCPINGACAVLCESGRSCLNIVFYAHQSSSFTLTSEGQYNNGGEENLGYAVVYCPQSTPNCNITGYSGTSLDGLTIHATNDFSDVDITCIGSGTCFNDMTFYCGGDNYNCPVDPIYLDGCDGSQLATDCDVPMDYIFVNETKTWQEAENYCINNYNTHLASVRSQDEFDAVNVLIPGGTQAWIGLNDNYTTDVWIWSDPDTQCVNGDCDNYIWWNTGEPGSSSEHCTAQSKDVQKWSDEDCNGELKFVCNAESRTPAPAPFTPGTVFPTTAKPTTSNPTTVQPTTSDPTTSDPTTSNTTTANSTSTAPSASNPTTVIPTTAVPTTDGPTTSSATTANPTLIIPDQTTADPTTDNPTSAAPSISNATTAIPTTAVPTTYLIVGAVILFLILSFVVVMMYKAKRSKVVNIITKETEMINQPGVGGKQAVTEVDSHIVDTMGNINEHSDKVDRDVLDTLK